MGCGSSQDRVVAVTTASTPEEWEAIRKRLAFTKSRYDTKRRDELWDKIDKDRSGSLTFIEVEQEAVKVLGLDKAMPLDQLRPVLIRAFNAAKKFRTVTAAAATATSPLSASEGRQSMSMRNGVGVGSRNGGLVRNSSFTNRNGSFANMSLAESVRLDMASRSPVSAAASAAVDGGGGSGGLPLLRSSSNNSLSAGRGGALTINILEGSHRGAREGSMSPLNPLSSPKGAVARPPLAASLRKTNINVGAAQPQSPAAMISADVFGEDLEEPAEQTASTAAAPFKLDLSGVKPGDSLVPIIVGDGGGGDSRSGTSSPANNNNNRSGGTAAADAEAAFLESSSNMAPSGGILKNSNYNNNNNNNNSGTFRNGRNPLSPTALSSAGSPMMASSMASSMRPRANTAGGSSARPITAASQMGAAQKEKFNQLQREEFRIFLMYIADYMELYVIFQEIANGTTAKNNKNKNENGGAASKEAAAATAALKARASAMDASVRESNPKRKEKKKGGFFSSSGSGGGSSKAIKFVTAVEFIDAIPRLVEWGIEVDEKDPIATFHLIDTSRSGTISFKEFSDWVILQHMHATA